MSGTASATNVPVVFELDDLCDRYDPFAALVALKAERPELKVTLFAIPGQCSAALLEKYAGMDWVQLGIHGYHHSTIECSIWTDDETRAKVGEVEDLGYFAKVFRAPGWVANECVYATLKDMGYVAAVHADYSEEWAETAGARYCYNQPGEFHSVHGHTWETCGNGPSKWVEWVRELPPESRFVFVSEAAVEASCATS